MENQLYNDTKAKMRRTVEVLRTELVKIRTGRANPALIENIKVKSYGTDVPVSHIASITTPQPRQLLIKPWDKNTLHDIEKAILKSDLGLMPSSDGSVIRLNLPPLTEESRQALSKLVHRIGEENKIAVRNIRRGAMETIREEKKGKNVSEDEAKRVEGKIQKLTDSYIKEIEEILEAKDEEILEG